MHSSVRQIICCSAAATGLLLSACGNHDVANQAPAGPTSAATAPHAVPPVPPTVAPAPTLSGAAPAISAPLRANPMEPSMTPPAGATSVAPAASSTTASVTTPDAVGGLTVTKVVVGDRVTDHKVNKAVDVIPADRSSIYASVETIGQTDGTTVSARWTYLEGGKQLVSAISQSIATSGPAVTTFRIQNPHSWPAGKYKVDIALNGKPISSKSFEVKSA